RPPVHDGDGSHPHSCLCAHDCCGHGALLVHPQESRLLALAVSALPSSHAGYSGPALRDRLCGVEGYACAKNGLATAGLSTSPRRTPGLKVSPLRPFVLADSLRAPGLHLETWEPRPDGLYSVGHRPALSKGSQC